MFELLRARIRYVGWRCVLHLHPDWFTINSEVGYYYAVRRCGHCGEPESKRLLRLVERERYLWQEVPKELPADDQERWIVERLHPAPTVSPLL